MTQAAEANVVQQLREIEVPAPENGSSANLIAVPQNQGLEWMWILLERWPFLARAVIIGVVLSTLIAFLIPKRYESITQLMPPDPQSSSGMAMLAALSAKGVPEMGALAGDLLGVKSSGALFTKILGSRTVQDRLIQRFDLRKVYWDRYWEDARKDLTKYTNVSEDRKSGVLTIVVTDRDAKRAEQMAEAYVEELDRLVAQVTTSSARRERVFIEQRLQTVKRDLDSSAQQFSEYASKNAAVDIAAQTKATVEAAARLQGELIAAESQLQGQEQIYSDDNVRVLSLRARVGQLRRRLQEIGGDSSDSSSQNSKSEQEFPSIRKLPLLGVKWAELYRQTKIEETVYELLTQQYEMAKIQEAKEIPTVKVLDVANMPEKKSFPPRSFLIILGTALTVAMTVLWIAASEIWEATDPTYPTKAFILEAVSALKGNNLGIHRAAIRGGTLPSRSHGDS